MRNIEAARPTWWTPLMEEGAIAHWQGDALADNPYGDNRAVEWFKGWLLAELGEIPPPEVEALDTDSDPRPAGQCR